MLGLLALALADPRATEEQKERFREEVRRILREGEQSPNHRLPNPHRPPRRR